ncbi:insulin receptor substrate 1-like [Acanthochromis polyacanthus]|uniref:insulin receptor substrate 1-like n=1 Tax=Acanthochromis polyacanthus TaxID=80966 RepID=UPI002234D5E0|nr:insulin receptor substrate 1-like [Acanthochromis polyacanthus]
MAESDNKWASRSRSPPAPCSPLSSRRCSSVQTWLPVESPPCSDGQTEQEEGSGECLTGTQAGGRRSSRFYEELFCTSQTSIPLAGALMTSSRPQSDVVKQGYLGKLERSHRRYFVLRAGSHTGPSRLEWYKSQQKFTAVEKAVGKAVLFESSKQGVIYLRCCLGVSRIGSSRKGHTVALYAKDQTMVLVMEDEQEQESWYVAMKKLMEEEQREEGLDEEDDGYCTLPPAAFFKEVWPVTVKPRGLGSSKSLTGESRLCLTAASLILVRVSAGSDLPSVTIPLLSVRRFGHWDGLFFLELGRSAPNGPGEIWMEARDEGDLALAQHIHEAVREAIGRLRALPDFTRSPTSSHCQPQTLLASKRCRPKYRDKPQSMRPPCPLVLLPRNPDIQTSPSQSHSRPCITDDPKLESYLSFTSHLSPFRAQQSCKSETGSYVEMRMDQHSVAAFGMQQWEPVKEEDGPGYMIMSPSVSHSSSVVKDDYVTMASPQKHEQPAYDSSSSLQTSFISSTSDSCSPPHPTRPQTNKHSLPQWLLTSVQQSETDGDQSQVSIGCSAPPQDDERQQQKSAQTTASSARVGIVEQDRMRLETRPHVDTGQSARRRRWLSLCLPSCLQADDRS